MKQLTLYNEETINMSEIKSITNTFVFCYSKNETIGT